MLSIDGVRKRMQRLDELGRGLAKERTIIRQADDPLLDLERRKHLCALDDALHGIDSARVALARALVRLGAAQADNEVA